MRADETRDQAGAGEPSTDGQFTGEAGPADAPAWEEIATGRYMPRRIKGSYKGRALG
jgi:hypothetical protein